MYNQVDTCLPETTCINHPYCQEAGQQQRFEKKRRKNSNIKAAFRFKRDQNQFESDCLSPHGINYHVQNKLAKGHKYIVARQGLTVANTKLLRATKHLKYKDLILSASDEEIEDFCKSKAASVRRKVPRDGCSLSGVESYCRALCDRYHIEFPEPRQIGGPIEPSIKRVASERWWRRKVRSLQMSCLDNSMRSLDMVNAKSQVYCSDELLYRRRLQNKRNNSMMNSYKAVNQDGDEYLLSELSDLSVSNPDIRHDELVTRAKGFDDVADHYGHCAEFYTFTAPSKYHPMKKITIGKGKRKRIKVYPNKSYQGFTVRESHQWIQDQWVLIRSALDRANIRIYGFRVVEPHHSGTAHWHLMLWMCPSQAMECRYIIRGYMLREDGDEKGAKNHRVNVKRITPNDGSATGYLIKYISKNVHGKHIDDDLLGNSGAVAVERVKAWASGHRIRQFQQFGGPPVTVWRELRRMDNDCIDSESRDDYLSAMDNREERARRAADYSQWGAFVMAMGGPFARRKEHAFKIARWHEVNKETGELIDPPQTIYGDDNPGKIIGVWSQLITGITEEGEKVIELGKLYVSRFYDWTVERVHRIPKKLEDIFDYESWANAQDLLFRGLSPPRTCVNKCTKGVG